MIEHLLLALSAVAVLGISAQWIGWRFSIPSILLLLTFGIVAGPVTGLLDPGALMGDLLYPVVSLAVAIILFEGGLSLSLKEFKEIGVTVARLVTVGMAVTWALSAVFAHGLLGLDWGLSILFGAVLVVTGPTVIVPMLRHIRPTGQTGPILKWEGIVIDPIGAMLAVLVFQIITAPGEDITTLITAVLLKTIVVGTVIGLAAAALLVLVLKRDWAPDYLQNPITVMLVISAFTGSNLLQHESGLLAVTVMGFTLANQKQVSVAHIVEFKENLQVMLIATIFILLAAHLKPADLNNIGFGAFVFLALLLVVVRPAAIFASTFGTSLTTKEKLFLSWLAPRGIVAAAVASIFALRLQEIGYEGADQLVATTFFVIIGTVTIYGLTAGRVARHLELTKADPEGVLLLGGKPWVRAIAKALKNEGYSVLMVDNVRAHVRAAKMEGVPAHYASVFSENILEQVELSGIGKLLALDANDDVNSLAALHFAPIFGRNQIYQLSPDERSGMSAVEETTHAREEHNVHLRGRIVFGEKVTHGLMTVRHMSGWIIKKTRITEEFDYDDFQHHYGGDVMPLFTISDATGKLLVYNAESKKPGPGTTVVALVKPRKEEAAE